MTGAIALHPVRTFEVELAATVHGAAFPESPWSADEIGQVLAMPGTFGLLASTEGVPAGFIAVRVVLDEAELITVGVSPYRRRLGLARALLAAGEARAAIMGAVRLFLEVAETNGAARGLYAAAGYRPVGRRRGYYDTSAGPLDALVLRKNLAV